MTAYLIANGEDIEIGDEFVDEYITKGALLFTDSYGDLLEDEPEEESAEGEELDEDEEADEDRYFILNPQYKFSATEVTELLSQTN